MFGFFFPLEYEEGLTCCFSPAFSVAFLFNWIGFFLSFCLTTSAAGRYGAISGFGLSLIKWILIVRVSCLAQNHGHRHCCSLSLARFFALLLKLVINLARYNETDFELRIC